MAECPASLGRRRYLLGLDQLPQFFKAGLCCIHFAIETRSGQRGIWMSSHAERPETRLAGVPGSAARTLSRAESLA